MRRAASNGGASVALLCALCLPQTACEQAPAALEVGEVRYSEEELGALTTSQRARLALLTALGLAVAEGRVDELVQPLVDQARKEQLIGRLTLEEAARISGLDEQELRTTYRADPELELTVRHLVVLAERWRNDEVRAAARATAAAALERIHAGESFATVAGEVSEEPGASRDGGLLPSGRRGSWVPEFWNAALSLEEDETSDVVETQYGYHVIQLVERDTVPFDSVRYDALSRMLEVVAAVPDARRILEVEDETILAHRADSMGIPVDRAALERTRSDVGARIANLATAFGFAPGADEEEVKAAAMKALGDPRQSVRIALTELAELEPALETMFEMR